MNTPGKLPVKVVPAASAALLALGALSAVLLGNIAGWIIAVVLGIVGAAGLALWWRVLRRPEAMIQKLMERRDLLEEKTGRGVPQDYKRTQTIDASPEDIALATKAAAEMLGNNRASRRATEAAVKKATRNQGRGSGGRVTPKGGAGK